MMSHWHGGLLDETTIGTRCCLFVAVRSLCCSQSVLSPGQVQIYIEQPQRLQHEEHLRTENALLFRLFFGVLLCERGGEVAAVLRKVRIFSTFCSISFLGENSCLSFYCTVDCPYGVVMRKTLPINFPAQMCLSIPFHQPSPRPFLRLPRLLLPLRDRPGVSHPAPGHALVRPEGLGGGGQGAGGRRTGVHTLRPRRQGICKGTRIFLKKKSKFWGLNVRHKSQSISQMTLTFGTCLMPMLVNLKRAPTA